MTGRFLTQTWMVERRARQIADPIERLKYLRRQTHAPKARATMAGMQQFRFRLLRVTGVLVAAVMVAVSGGWSPDAAGVSTREHKLLVPGLAAAMNLKSTSVISSVWQVEGTEMTEVYSNGLRVDLTFAVRNRPRAHYPIYSLTGAVVPASYGKTPRGLVYHTTQSHLAPFEESSNRQLRQLGRNLLELLRRERSYHYVIDRFGRVCCTGPALSEHGQCALCVCASRSKIVAAMVFHLPTSSATEGCQLLGSIPIRSFTADRMRCLQPRYRSVDRTVELLGKVKPTAAMPRPGPHSTKAKRVIQDHPLLDGS